MEQQRVTLANGIELDVVDTGPGEGSALLFLHGFPESHRTWRHQIAHFSDRFRCIAPDQRGYRSSSKPQEVSAYTPDKLIGDIFQLADTLGVGEFTIVGHDWGGAIAWGVAIGGQMAGRVTRCIIANAPHPAIFQKLLYTNEHQRTSSQYMRGFRDPANDVLVREHGLAAILMKEVKWDRPSQMEPEERDRLLAEWQDREAAFGMLNWYRASPVDVPPLDAPYALPDGWTPPPLPKLTIPTLVIWAMDDLALPAENLDGLDEVVENLTIARVPDCGHFVPWEAPDKVNAAMEEFLGRTA
jgi:pimeloyl-ACP methyl ester carboxylesterase